MHDPRRRHQPGPAHVHPRLGVSTTWPRSSRSPRPRRRSRRECNSNRARRQGRGRDDEGAESTPRCVDYSADRMLTRSPGWSCGNNRAGTNMLSASSRMSYSIVQLPSCDMPTVVPRFANEATTRCASALRQGRAPSARPAAALCRSSVRSLEDHPISPSSPCAPGSVFPGHPRVRQTRIRERAKSGFASRSSGYARTGISLTRWFGWVGGRSGASCGRVSHCTFTVAAPGSGMAPASPGGSRASFERAVEDLGLPAAGSRYSGHGCDYERVLKSGRALKL